MSPRNEARLRQMLREVVRDVVREELRALRPGGSVLPDDAQEDDEDAELLERARLAAARMKKAR